MGTLDLHGQHLEEAALIKGSSILVVASPAYLEVLSAENSEAIPGLRTAALEPSDPVATSLFANTSVLVIEVDPHSRASMQRIGDIREKQPHLPVVAAINGASVSLVRTLVRQGISDVVALPLDVEDLLQVSLNAVAKRDAAEPTDQVLAPMIAVARSLGGCGATSIATHLAAELAAHDQTGRGAVIADLDLQFGSVADYLGVRPRGSLLDLLEAEGRLDEDLLKSVAVEAGGGVSVIAAPDKIMPLESVDVDDLLRTVRLLRRQFGYVVLDLPANWTNWTLSTALTANAVVLVVELSIASLRQAKRRIELFRSVGIEDGAIHIVVNRVEKRLFRTIDLDDVSRTLGHSVLGSISLEAPLVGTAQDQGALVSTLHRKSRFAKDIAQLGALLRDSLSARG